MVAQRRVNDTRCLEAGSGWPVVLLHAFPVNADMWRPQLERVPDGWHFVAPDLAGGTVEEMADGVLRVLDGVGLERAVIGGLSMGGYVAFAVYRRAPERFHGLVLADTRAAADTPEARETRRRLMALVRDKGTMALADEMMPKLLGKTALDAQPDLQPLVREMAAGVGAGQLERSLNAMMHRPDSTPMLERISVATLVLCGDEDAATPLPEVERMQLKIPRSRLVVLHGAGHLSNLEKPDEFSTALADFLTSNI